MNRFLRAKKLEIKFKKPWDFLFKMPEITRKEIQEKSIKIQQNALWWDLLEKVRTFYEENPE
jgi:hypothetical protein